MTVDQLISRLLLMRWVKDEKSPDSFDLRIGNRVAAFIWAHSDTGYITVNEVFGSEHPKTYKDPQEVYQVAVKLTGKYT